MVKYTTALAIRPVEPWRGCREPCRASEKPGLGLFARRLLPGNPLWLRHRSTSAGPQPDKPPIRRQRRQDRQRLDAGIIHANDLATELGIVDTPQGLSRHQRPVKRPAPDGTAEQDNSIGSEWQPGSPWA